MDPEHFDAGFCFYAMLSDLKIYNTPILNIRHIYGVYLSPKYKTKCSYLSIFSQFISIDAPLTIIEEEGMRELSKVTKVF